DADLRTLNGRMAAMMFGGMVAINPDCSQTSESYHIDITPRVLANGAVRLEAAAVFVRTTWPPGGEEGTTDWRQTHSVTVRPGETLKFRFRTDKAPTWAEVTTRVVPIKH